jgi:hypothetical protein
MRKHATWALVHGSPIFEKNNNLYVTSTKRHIRNLHNEIPKLALFIRHFTFFYPSYLLSNLSFNLDACMHPLYAWFMVYFKFIFYFYFIFHQDKGYPCHISSVSISCTNFQPKKVLTKQKRLLKKHVTGLP